MRLILLRLGLGLALLPGLAGDGQPSNGRIPSIRTDTLAGVPVTLPDGARGRPVILVVGFTQGSRDAVTLWGRQLAEGYGGSSSVRHYEMAVLAGVPRVLRGLVGGRIKASMPDVARAHFLYIFDHEAEWRAAVGYSSPDDAYVLLVDGEGRVRWQTHGVPTSNSSDELQRFVISLLQVTR